MVPVGCYIEDYVHHVTKFVKEQLPIEAVLFDRGFGSWGVIYKLRKLPVPFIIFWKKQGNWYKEHFDELEDGECKIIHRESKYNRDKTNHKVNSDFVLIKQLEYDGKKYDWIFATNLKENKAAFYVKLYKKRWCIETIYRVTDKIKIYTTSTNCVIRYFLFMFTCFVYNIWKSLQMFLGEDFTLSNHKTNMTIFMAKHGMIYPKHYDRFEMIAEKLFNI
jgi:IS4 transposase